jgi:uncharacterized membrane protein
MADTQRTAPGFGDLAMRVLREEGSRRFDAAVGHLAQQAGKAVTRTTERLVDVSEREGPLFSTGPPGGGAGLPAAAALLGLDQVSVKGIASGLVPGKAKAAKDLVAGVAKGGSGDSEDSEGSGGDRKAGSTKVTNIVEMIDVGVPLRTAYDHWTQFEEFSDFTKGVQSVSKGDDTTSDWTVKIAFSTRSFEATVEEQVPDERIVWTSKGAKGSTRGAVSFHELAPALTRIVAVIEYYPSGFFEKTGNLWRAQGRRVRLDLKHFQRYVSLTEEDAEGWRGEIRDSEVVRTHEEALEDEEQDGEEQDGEEEEPEDAEDYEDEDEEDEEPEEEDDEEPEDEEEDWEEEEEPAEEERETASR